MNWSRVGKRTAPRALAIIAALGGLFASCGWPVWPPVGVASVSYPCQSRACGCVTAEKCWAGDCCCFTLEDKLAWADARNLEVPAHVRPLVRARVESEKPKCAACAKSNAPRWVIGVQSEKCRNKRPGTVGGMGELFAATPASPRLVGVTGTAFGLTGDVDDTRMIHFPPTPPPRRA